DLAVINRPGYWVSLLLGNGDGTFQPRVAYFAGYHDANEVQIADLNGDGHSDLVVGRYEYRCGSICSGQSADSIAIFLGDGPGAYGAPSFAAAGEDPLSVAVADMNGDSIPDVIAGDYGLFSGGGYIQTFATSLALLPGNGDGSFGRAPRFEVGPPIL